MTRLLTRGMTFCVLLLACQPVEAQTGPDPTKEGGGQLQTGPDPTQEGGAQLKDGGGQISLPSEAPSTSSMQGDPSSATTGSSGAMSAGGTSSGATNSTLSTYPHCSATVHDECRQRQRQRQPQQQPQSR